jgi:predicted nucleic acid-binding protein
LILVDSSVWIDYFRGAPTPQSQRLDALLGEEPVLMGDLILAEVLRGFTRDLDFHRAQKRLAAVPVLTLGGRDIALQAARNCRSLRTLGCTVRGTVDAIIATRCIEDDLMLLHSDADFDPFETHLGLKRLY